MADLHHSDVTNLQDQLALLLFITCRRLHIPCRGQRSSRNAASA